MNYYYQLEMLAGLFVMSSFLVAGALWCAVMEMRYRNNMVAQRFEYQVEIDKNRGRI